jgi:hypothetical protein
VQVDANKTEFQPADNSIVMKVLEVDGVHRYITLLPQSHYLPSSSFCWYDVLQVTSQRAACGGVVSGQ